MAADDIIDILRPYRDQFKERTLRSGKVKVRIDLTPREGPYLDMSERAILAPVAAAVVEQLRDEIRNVVAPVSEATVEFRRYTATTGRRKFRGWYARRYSGGKIGLMLPQGGTTAMFESGRFLQSLTASITGTRPVRATVNVAANRLDKSTFTASAWSRFTAQLKRWVPSLSPGAVFKKPGVQDAIAGVLADRLARTQAEIKRKTGELRRAVLSLVRSAVG